MNIVVCIKQVVHIYVANGVDLTTHRMVADGTVRIVNPYDEVAVEEALRIREDAGKGTVSVITVGPPQAEDSLRWCLAMGADHAIHVVDEAGQADDPWLVSRVLAGLIRTLDYDLILCGKMSIDYGMGQVGTFVAELLNLPVVSAVTDIMLDSSKRSAEVQRALERGNREIVQSPLPAVFTVEKSLNKPRYPTLPRRLVAKKMDIRKIPAQDIGREGTIHDPVLELFWIAPPKIRPRKILSPDASLSAAGRLSFVMSGGMGEKKGGRIGGNPEQLAKGIFDFLKDKKFIPT